MEFLYSLLNRSPEELRPAFLILGCIFCLAALVTLIWWLVNYDASSSVSDSITGSDDPDLVNPPAKWKSRAGSREKNGKWAFSPKERGSASQDAQKSSETPAKEKIAAGAEEPAKRREENAITGSREDDSKSGGSSALPGRASVDSDNEVHSVEGGNQEVANESTGSGIRNTASLSERSDPDETRSTDSLDAEGLEADSDDLQKSSRADRSGLVASAFAGESVRSDERFGILYDAKPDRVDDLTSIKGIGGVLEERLNQEGVYRYKQIANWDENNTAQFGDHLEFPGRIERDEWIPQAKKLAQNGNGNGNGQVTIDEEPEPDLPDENRYEGLTDQYEGEAVRLDQKLGVLFEQPANCKDDLTDISGIGNVLQKTLNEKGIYRFQQIADWNEYNAWSFNRIISFPGRIQRDEWIRQAKGLAPGSRCLNPGSARVSADDLDDIVSLEFSGEDVEIRGPFGIVYQTPPSEQDKLQDIKGVGPVLEKKLHEFGVYKFKQIANWPDAAIDEFQQQLSFPDRIRRDDWVGQCEKFTV